MSNTISVGEDVLVYHGGRTDVPVEYARKAIDDDGDLQIDRVQIQPFGSKHAVVYTKNSPFFSALLQEVPDTNVDAYLEQVSDFVRLAESVRFKEIPPESEMGDVLMDSFTNELDRSNTFGNFLLMTGGFVVTAYAAELAINGLTIVGTNILLGTGAELGLCLAVAGPAAVLIVVGVLVGIIIYNVVSDYYEAKELIDIGRESGNVFVFDSGVKKFGEWGRDAFWVGSLSLAATGISGGRYIGRKLSSPRFVAGEGPVIDMEISPDGTHMYPSGTYYRNPAALQVLAQNGSDTVGFPVQPALGGAGMIPFFAAPFTLIELSNGSSIKLVPAFTGDSAFPDASRHYLIFSAEGAHIGSVRVDLSEPADIDLNLIDPSLNGEMIARDILGEFDHGSMPAVLEPYMFDSAGSPDFYVVEAGLDVYGGGESAESSSGGLELASENGGDATRIPGGLNRYVTQKSDGTPVLREFLTIGEVKAFFSAVIASGRDISDVLTLLPPPQNAVSPIDIGSYRGMLTHRRPRDAFALLMQRFKYNLHRFQLSWRRMSIWMRGMGDDPKQFLLSALGIKAVAELHYDLMLIEYYLLRYPELEIEMYRQNLALYQSLFEVMMRELKAALGDITQMTSSTYSQRLTAYLVDVAAGRAGEPDPQMTAVERNLGAITDRILSLRVTFLRTLSDIVLATADELSGYGLLAMRLAEFEAEYAAVLEECGALLAQIPMESERELLRRQFVSAVESMREMMMRFIMGVMESATFSDREDTVAALYDQASVAEIGVPWDPAVRISISADRQALFERFADWLMSKNPHVFREGNTHVWNFYYSFNEQQSASDMDSMFDWFPDPSTNPYLREYLRLIGMKMSVRIDYTNEIVIITVSTG